VQKLGQIPESARKIINQSWGDDFESYNITKGGGRIKGIKCKITQDQWNRLADWEFEEFGWFVPKEVEIRNLATGQTERIMTMIMGGEQQYDRKVDGENYEPFLMPKEKTLQIAAMTKRLYDERFNFPQEGQIGKVER